MAKFLLGMSAVICLFFYSDGIKGYFVETGIRDLVVAYLQMW